MVQKQVENYLTDNYRFGYNTVVNKPSFSRKSCKSCPFSELTDFALNSILRDLKNQGFRMNKANLRDLLQSDFVEKFNPIESYFEKLQPWDGQKDYVKHLCDTLNTNNDDLFYWAFKKWLVAMVACGLQEDVSNHLVIIFTGGQGIGKSRWIERLLPDELAQYMNSDRLSVKDKDTLIQLSENILIILEEIGAFKPSDVDAIKELISKNVIKLRRAYGTYAESYIRRASFIGSSNNEEILVDVTGNRRFLVFQLEDVVYPDHIDLDKVYSQVYHLYKDGFKYWFDKEDVLKINLNNESFRHITCEEEFLLKYFEPLLGKPKTAIYLSAQEVIDYISNRDKSSKIKELNSIQMGKVLKARGFNTTKKKGFKKYILKEII